MFWGVRFLDKGSSFSRFEVFDLRSSFSLLPGFPVIFLLCDSENDLFYISN